MQKDNSSCYKDFRGIHFVPSKYTKESITPLPPTLIFSIFFKAQWKQLLLISQRFTLWQYRRGVIMVDHVRGRRRLASSRRRFGAAGHSILGRFDLEPGVPKRLGKVIIHRASDGHRVCYWLGLFVILAEAPAKMFFYHRVTSSWSVWWSPKVRAATTMGNWAVRKVAVPVAWGSTCDYRRSVLLSFHWAHAGGHSQTSGQVAVFGECQRLIHTDRWNWRIHMTCM